MPHRGNIMYGDTNHLSNLTFFLICVAIMVGSVATYLAIFAMRSVS